MEVRSVDRLQDLRAQILRLGLPLSPDTPWVCVQIVRTDDHAASWQTWWSDGQHFAGAMQLGGARWPAAWADFEVLAFGILCRAADLEAGEPALRFPERPDLAARLILMTTWHPKRPYLAAVVRWVPAQGPVDSIQGAADDRVTESDLWRTRDGLLILKGLSRTLAGRPSGVTALGDSEETRKELLRIGRLFLEKRERKPTEEELSDLLDLSANADPERQLRKWLKAAGFPDYEHYRQALACE